MSQSQPLIVPLSRWQRSGTSIEDANPRKFQPSVLEGKRSRLGNEFDSNLKKACAVCLEYESRYQCPRCGLPYCSVDCYNKHTTAEKSTTTTTDDYSSSSCTEAFYKNRVSDILKLEALEQQEKTKQILNRQHQRISPNEAPVRSDIAEDELYEVLLALEGKKDVVEKDIEELQAMLSPSLRDAFNDAIQNGQLNHLILDAWHPWWRQELVSDHDEEEEGAQKDASVVNNSFAIGFAPASPSTSFASTKTLDERILRIQPFDSIYTKNQGPPPKLLYNLVDILYSCTWTLRLYHGATNACSDSLSVEGSDTLLLGSAVLSKDTRYETLEEVLFACTTRSMKFYATAGCNAHWTTLAEDVAILMTCYRYVARMVFEILDILKAAIGKLKNMMKDGDDEREKIRSRVAFLRRIRKKLEFFLSWLIKYKGELVGVESSIRSWAKNWNISSLGKSDVGDEGQLDDLILPTAVSSQLHEATPAPTTHSRHQESPLLVQLQTRQKASDAN